MYIKTIDEKVVYGLAKSSIICYKVKDKEVL